MFELEPAVNQWCAEVSRRITDSDDLRAELKDHLYCEIESLRDQGLSEEQAFRLAVQKLGDPTELVSEYRENRRLLSVFCKAADPSLNVYSQQRSNIMTYRQNVKRILTQSLLWATAIVTSGLLLGEAEQYFT